ncbi:MAG: NAD(P)H-dependent oxidoreductase [Azonexus sp.]|nr:NAD(P)H-dependent oxidoreductase [Azonexus sp.]
MKLLILDGTIANSPVGQYTEQVGLAHGADVTRFALGEIQIAPCLGDFECWTKTPGRCRTHDAAQKITQAIHDADLVTFLTPVVFGGYASALKKLVDRLIPLTDAFFHEQAGMTRHQRRYERYPAMLFIGLTDQADEEAQSLFTELAGGNAINLQTPWFSALLVSLRDNHWHQRIEIAVRNGLTGGPGEALPLPEKDALARACTPDFFAPESPAPRTATILIGSARPKGSSTSESLANELSAGLEQAGIRTTLVHAISFVKDGILAEKALATILAGELLVVATPLYVDALPALVTRGLEQLAEKCRDGKYPLRSVVGLLNCGFPEASHNRSAVNILRIFSHECGLVWAGGLAMGAGEIIHGQPLANIRLVARAQIRALRRAASDLAGGQGISQTASDDMARPLLPAFLFRWLAPFKWIRMGRQHGIGWRQLHARPLNDPAGSTQPPSCSRT